MTEYEIVNTAATAFGNGLNSFTVFFSMVTAYLIVAYIAGRSLSRPQVILVNACYFLAAGFFGLFSVITFMRGAQLAQAAQEVQSIASYQGNSADWGWIWIGMIVAIVLIASFYFMWTVRHR